MTATQFIEQLERLQQELAKFDNREAHVKTASLHLKLAVEQLKKYQKLRG